MGRFEAAWVQPVNGMHTRSCCDRLCCKRWDRHLPTGFAQWENHHFPLIYRQFPHPIDHSLRTRFVCTADLYSICIPRWIVSLDISLSKLQCGGRKKEKRVKLAIKYLRVINFIPLSKHGNNDQNVFRGMLYSVKVFLKERFNGQCVSCLWSCYLPRHESRYTYTAMREIS